MTTVIIDYGSGNLRSAAKSFQRAAGDEAPGIVVTDDPERVRRADRVVLPGVGAFGDCRDGLAAIAGMDEALTEAVIERGRPFFGICVGMQLMASRGLEHGTYAGFGWIPGNVERLAPADAALKIPHMGWNTLALGSNSHPLFEGLRADAHVYFVHSYHLVPTDPSHLLATTDYGGPVTAAVGRDNLVGTQFHPEKSQRTGLKLITNFLAWSP